MIAWVDLETTGLDPKTSSILEVAFVLTDDELVEEDHIEVVVKPLFGSDQMNEFVLNMHTKSGLLTDIPIRGLRRYEAEEKLLDFVFAYVIGKNKKGGKVSLEKTALAGSTVGFDRAFLKEHMPDLECLFHYRSIDVSSLNELAARWRPDLHENRPKDDPNTQHRALTDIRLSIEQLRYYRKNWLCSL